MEDNKIPMLDASSEDFKNELDFAIWSTHSASDYRNDRDRPYNGQDHTDEGLRGKTEVNGLTMRDIKDCLIKAMLISSPPKEYLTADEFFKCWNFKNDNDEEPTPTKYLLDNQDKYISSKVETDTWRVQDVYKTNWNDIDPLAIAKNMTCEIEKMMGIFPNVPPLKINEIFD